MRSSKCGPTQEDRECPHTLKLHLKKVGPHLLIVDLTNTHQNFATSHTIHTPTNRNTKPFKCDLTMYWKCYTLDVGQPCPTRVEYSYTQIKNGPHIQGHKTLKD